MQYLGKLKSIDCAKDPGVGIASNLKLSHQCPDTVNKPNRMWGLTDTSQYRNKNILIPLRKS